MKKFVSLFILTSVVLGLCACNNAQPEQKSEPAQATEVATEVATEKAPQTETAASSDVSNNPAFASSADEFKQNIDKLINASEYEVRTDDTAVSYALTAKNTVDYNLDYVIDFNDESSIKLPTNYADMKDSGWTTTEADSKEISNKVQTGIKYSNANDESFILWTQNIDDSKTEKNIPLKDAKLYACDINIFSEKSKKNDAGEYEKYYEKNKSPEFSVCGGITEASTISDIIEKLGKPSNIGYYIKRNGIDITYRVKMDNAYSTIQFFFVEGGKFMNRMKYEYSYAD